MGEGVDRAIPQWVTDVCAIRDGFKRCVLRRTTEGTRATKFWFATQNEHDVCVALGASRQ